MMQGSVVFFIVLRTLNLRHLLATPVKPVKIRINTFQIISEVEFYISKYLQLAKTRALVLAVNKSLAAYKILSRRSFLS